jgi:hypothetical protein
LKTKIWPAILIASSILAQSPSSVQSQKKNPPSPFADEDLKARIRQQQIVRILAVLRTTADDARTWTDASAASRVQAQIADVMWSADSEVAREYLIRAWDAAAKVEDSKSERSRYRNESLRTNARREVILIARKRAPDLSKKWLDQMAQEVTEAKHDRGLFDDRTTRSTLLLQMAMQIVQEKPEAAATLAIESLQDGVSFGFQQVLIKIQEKNVELSQEVFRAALMRLRTAGMIDPNELLILHSFLYTPGRIVAANTGENSGRFQLAVGRNSSQLPALAQLNPALALDFLRLAAGLLINAPMPAATADPVQSARLQLSTINVLLVPISERLPDLSVALRTRAQQITSEARLTPVAESAPANTPRVQPGENSKSYAERRVDLLERAAQNETFTLSRDIAYAKAALATTAENYSRGSDLGSKIDNKELRDNIRNWLIYRASLHFLRVDDLEKAYELVGRNNDPVQKAASLVIGAQRLIKAKEKMRATQWLMEARSLIRKAEPNEETVHVLLGIVTTFGRVDRIIAFEALSEAVRLMSKTPIDTRDDDRVPMLKRFTGLEVSSDFTYGTEDFSLRSAIGAFGPEQFEDVLGIVNRISGGELRGVAITELCRIYLK